ncbi:methylmalonyl Co-A mutase-associated GTPase MeaB [Brevibacillus parabrevis]|uniref:methylmalonyl Co-A mutase-associated GTPase MeaB n=1 Tax=Brevibacillus parabrevis TaxID=54914 RepID=UPI0028535E75|nr:methylmalonyl Co-A mutase-associated GTPase MeaB [Brevibacillus parabrevis]MDR5002517.1 methylmalonyl Co-A mutase-associated GTPase MeaB [Brevibacillus parabrevis]
MSGGGDGKTSLNFSSKVRLPRLSVEQYVEGVRANNRTVLAQAITLVESNSAAHMDMAQEVIRQLLPHTGQSIRIGVSGVPGAGKSTFIEAFGTMLCEKGHRVAVLAVDPSSTVTRGSILGDKTRMELLSRNPNAFIRPSATGGTLGGVNRKTRETMLICEAAGYDVILVETVGVGQSETTVRSMVDFFLLLMLTGAGDELQGIKKGIMEIADALLINKADGENRTRALIAKGEYNRVLHYLQPATSGWETKAYMCSAMTGEGIADIWEVVGAFRHVTGLSGSFEARRKAQLLDWMHSMAQDYLRTTFFGNPQVAKMLPAIEQSVTSGQLSPTSAVQQLVAIFEKAIMK